MYKKYFARKIENAFGLKAQAMVEFALVLPILLLVLYGVFEVGRLIFIYSAVTNASRNASRYASAYGFEDTGTYHKFAYCDGIENIATQSAYGVNPADLTITISYDSGPGTTSLGNCDFSGGDDPDIVAAQKDTDGMRVTVTVLADFQAVVSIVPIEDQTINSSSSRTILGIVDLD